jgi:hypothetical protein
MQKGIYSLGICYIACQPDYVLSAIHITVNGFFFVEIAHYAHLYPLRAKLNVSRLQPMCH